MSNKKRKITSDKLTILIALIALLISLFNFYYQYLYEDTILTIGDTKIVGINNSTEDTTKTNIQLLIINTGTNPVAITDWHTFLTLDKKTPTGCYSNGFNVEEPTIFTSSCNSKDKATKIITENTIHSIDLHLNIPIVALKHYIKTNINKFKNTDLAKINLGVRLFMVDSKGEKITKDIIPFMVTKEFSQKDGSITFRKTSWEGTSNWMLSARQKKIY